MLAQCDCFKPGQHRKGGGGREGWRGVLRVWCCCAWTMCLELIWTCAFFGFLFHKFKPPLVSLFRTSHLVRELYLSDILVFCARNGSRRTGWSWCFMMRSSDRVFEVGQKCRVWYKLQRFWSQKRAHTHTHTRQIKKWCALVVFLSLTAFCEFPN